MKVIISTKSDVSIKLGVDVVAKHNADGENSKLNVLDMNKMEDLVTLVSAKNTLALQKARDKVLAFEDRDIALGIAPGHQIGETDTVYYYIKATRDILHGVYKGNEHVLGNWGFTVSRGSAKIVVPMNAAKMITLASNILAQNTIEADDSPIKDLNIIEFTARLSSATSKHALAEQLNHEKQNLIQDRDILLGNARKQLGKNTGTLKYYLTSVRDVLLGIYKNNETALELWGFDVIYGSSQPTPPTSQICLTGIIYDNNNNPINNATVKIVQLNVMIESGSNGMYAFPMQTPGTYNIEFSKTNFITQNIAGQVIAAGQVKSLDVHLNSIAGSLIANVYCNSQPVPGATVRIADLNIEAITDGSGIAVLNNIATGSWLVLVTAMGKNPLSINVGIQPNSTASFSFNLTDIN